MQPSGGQKLDRVDEAIAAGELWRAKEILRGRIRGAPFDPDLFERYGQVLLRTGDDLEAGKFFLLSGKREAEYEAAIGLFLRRYSRGRWQRMFSTFPRSVRNCRSSDLPAATRGDLAKLGVPIDPRDEQVSFRAWTGREESAGVPGVVFYIVLLAAVGFVISVLVVHFFFEGR